MKAHGEEEVRFYQFLIYEQNGQSCQPYAPRALLLGK